MHDPCAVAFVIDPAVLTTRRAPLDVELHGALTTGMTVADLRGPEPADCHTRVAVTLDHARFWDLVVDALDPDRRPLSTPLRLSPRLAPMVPTWSACSPSPTR